MNKSIIIISNILCKIIKTKYKFLLRLKFNYRITDFQCALALSQLKKLDRFVARRRAIAGMYTQAFQDEPALVVLSQNHDSHSSFHIYVILARGVDRAELFKYLGERGIGVNVHYIPVHLQPYYRKTYGYCPGDYPIAEEYYRQAVTIPLYPAMTDDDVARVIAAVRESIKILLQ